MGMPHCGMRDCALNDFYAVEAARVCYALTENLCDPNTGVCPFFKDRTEARKEAKAAQARAEAAGCLMKGFYSAPTFTRDIYDGKKWITAPDFEAWLRWLHRRDIISEERLEKGLAWAAAH